MIEEKYILGVRHIKVMCIECKGMCWTQPMCAEGREHYRCKTCTEPKEIPPGRGMDMLEDMRFD